MVMCDVQRRRRLIKVGEPALGKAASSMWGCTLLAADANPSMPAAEGQKGSEGILRREWG